jgi:uracil-DNA glycosylase
VSLPALPDGWPGLRAERERDYFRELEAFLGRERREATVHPRRDQVFGALELTPRAAVRVVLVGQDPYHGAGQAHGLAFSVPAGIPKPPSLRNLLRELEDDLGAPIPGSGDLTPWARRGVLLLNAVLTVRSGEPGSHGGRGWERFTDAVIRAVDEAPDPVVFILLGNRAGAKATRVDRDRHGVVEAPHPSPLSAWRGFFGSRVFSRCNRLLEELGRKPVDWRLGD